MKLLPKEKWHLEVLRDGKHLAAGIYEHLNSLYYIKYDLSDLPNDFISQEDLESFGIGNFVNNLAI